MKERYWKRIEKLERLCRKINGLEMHGKERTGSNPIIFYFFYEETTAFEIQIYENGYDGCRPDKEFELYLDCFSLEDYIRCKRYLKKLLKRMEKEENEAKLL